MKVGYARVFTFEMDPITNAIVAAVSAGITEIGKKAFGDAYQGFLDLCAGKLPDFLQQD
jgi:hypothetical protein